MEKFVSQFHLWLIHPTKLQLPEASPANPAYASANPVSAAHQAARSFAAGQRQRLLEVGCLWRDDTH